jgi:hypothetical protein
MNLREHLPLIQAPESVWREIERTLESRPDAVTRAQLLQRRMFPAGAFVFAAAVSLFSLAAVYWIAQSGWVETPAQTSRTIRVGDIGAVQVFANTKLKVLKDRPSEHRLRLVRGRIYATITAPPQVFFVETRSGTAVDLGCEYALNMNEDGDGLLNVTRGWVSFQWKGLESLVPAGASCKIRAGAGPEVPRFDDASPAFVEALGRNQLDAILTNARVRDTLTLWHLIFRVTPADRARVYDRIAALVAIPPAISRDRALQLDRGALDRLKDELAWKW